MSIFRIFLALLVGGIALPFVQAVPPNVVLVMTDDQGYGDLSCHGNKELRTPNLDRLHQQSVRLTNFHVDPTCSPTRSALLTGRYSSRTGVWHTIGGRSLLRRDETTLADLFAAAGYRTGIFGKWHLGDNYPFRAVDRGWHESLVHGGGGIGQTADAWENTYFDDTYLRNGKPQPQRGYCTEVFFDAALKFIETNRERPFVCYLATNAPHSPYRVAPKYAKRFLDLRIRQPRANFYGMIENIDENMGRLLDRLTAWNLDRNTIVIFLTDNGTAAGWNEASGEGFNAGMRGIKGSVYEGGHRVPCFMRWPGQFPAETDVPELTAHIDLLPTLLEACEIKGKSRWPIDGLSLLGRLRNNAKLPQRTLFVHSQRVEHPQKWRQCAVLTPRWRLINGQELYDLVADPGQQTDLAKTQPKVVAELRQEYERWYESISTRFGEYCEIILGSERENPTTLTGHDWHGDVVPWNHESIKKMPIANGFWAVEIAQAGRYRFTLRHMPAPAKFPLEAARAKCRIGDIEVTDKVTPGSTEVSLTAQLQPGKTRLQTWLETDRVSRGAFYVTVERLQ